MLLTEEEAKTKWCPMVQFILAPPTYEGSMPMIMSNRGNSGTYDTSCLASDCHWWKWDNYSGEGYKYNAGYCGKVGK